MGNLCATPPKEAGRGAPELQTITKQESSTSGKKVKFSKETKDTNQDSDSNDSLDNFKFN